MSSQTLKGPVEKMITIVATNSDMKRPKVEYVSGYLVVTPSSVTKLVTGVYGDRVQA